MPGDEALQQTENVCIERCRSFGETHQQRWVKEASSDLLSHLYEALGERLALYTEHYRMPALIAYYNDLAKKHPGNSQAVIDEIRRRDNPENEVARAERYIATFRQKSEAQWQALEDRLNAKRSAANKPFNQEQAAMEAQKALEGTIQERAQLIQEKQETSLTEEELARIRAQQIALSIREVECQLKMRRKIVSRNGFSYESSFPEREQFRAEVNICENYDEYTAMERIRDFCKPENLFQANDLMRELGRYSTVAEIAASDLYELEKTIKDKPYKRSIDYAFCLLPEEENIPCSLQEALHRLLPESTDTKEQILNRQIYESWLSTLKANEIYIQINHQTNVQDQSKPVINYFVKSRAGGILEGTLTHEDVDRILENHSDASTLAQHMKKGRREDLVNILQSHITAFKNDIYKQLEKQARELSKKKNGTDEERKEYGQYKRYGKHVGIYEQSAKERNQMIQAGFEYVLDHVMRPIAEERARLLFIEMPQLSEALEKKKAKLDAIPDNSSQSCLSWSTEKDKLTRKIEKLENSIVLVQQKVDYLSGVLERNAKSIKEGKNSYDTPFSSITSLTNECSSYAYPDSAYRQNRTETCEENRRFKTARIEILNQARDYVTNFVRKLVGVILIPLRAILGSCAPESLQKQAFYNTQSAHRLFKAKSDWEKYNARTEKEFGLPLRDLAL